MPNLVDSMSETVSIETNYFLMYCSYFSTTSMDLNGNELEFGRICIQFFNDFADLE